MPSLYSKSAKFEDVVKDLDAFKFHLEKYQAGIINNLTRACYQYYMTNGLPVGN